MASGFVVITILSHPQVVKDFFYVFFVIYMDLLFTFEVFHPFGIYPGTWCEICYLSTIEFSLSVLTTY